MTSQRPAGAGVAAGAVAAGVPVPGWVREAIARLREAGILLEDDEGPTGETLRREAVAAVERRRRLGLDGIEARCWSMTRQLSRSDHPGGQDGRGMGRRRGVQRQRP